jgi:hypothetical protein
MCCCINPLSIKQIFKKDHLRPFLKSKSFLKNEKTCSFCVHENIQLKFQILHDLGNLLIKNLNKKLPLNESYIVIKLDGSKKLGYDVLSGTTKGWVCAMIYFEFISSSELCATIGHDSIIQITFMTN